MDGAHEGLLDAKGVVDDFGHGSQAVGGAGGVGDNVHVRCIVGVVDTHDERGSDFVLGGGGDDDLSGAVLEVGGGLLRGAVGAGGLDDVLGAAVIPGDVGRVVLAVYADLLAVDDQMPVVPLHRALEGAEDAVVFDLVDHVVQVRVAQVDAADLIAAAAPLHHDPQSHPSDSAEAVDAHFDCHCIHSFRVFVFYRRCGKPCPDCSTVSESFL